INGVRTGVLNEAPMTRGQFRHIWNHTPLINGFSPYVVPHAPDWPDHVYTTGYWFYDKHPDWQPDAALLDFLQAGPPPVYLGFGSMSNRNPEATANIMIEALKRTGQRGIISKGWAGLHSRSLPESIFLLDSAPHDWLFPQMAAIVHHGGAGTTATALRAGVPSTVVPHMADQFYWGRRVYELGVGDPAIYRHKLNVDRLATAIEHMISDQAMRQRAAELGVKLQQEDGVGNAVAAFQDILQQPVTQIAASADA
ncbi:MAG: glycosyltransferase, partial [Anaerolineae bacterium]|nr:glycosyltransferase [Anaerolineae bacterium]